ncbi:MAG: glycogen debranching protein, partial [Acetatifactor sp.]|nr:glycogen debranching protein [Acetatifactor sp.]
GHKTILAGFPFFEDWGRDTMIALTGCCLSTGQYDTAKSILQTFMVYCRRGLMPNLFPEGTEEAAYNTVDAALLFILAVYEYHRRTGDDAFVAQAYPVMQDIIRWYVRGTDYGIYMDQDGLIMAGQGYDQVTWMDVRVEDILPTPRHGKPVEINAYWYNALKIMEELAGERESADIDYGAMADKVLAAFEKTFWNEEKGCLRDVISGTSADDQVRCNQIWAVSLPFSLLPREKEIKVVETVFCKLYTPVGLRTLAPEDDQFHPFYGGAQLDRDLAYHQGTVWTFPLGGYYLAYLKVHDYSPQAKAYVEQQLAGIETALREGCVGQLPEIYDGDNPVSSKGCFAQAWSVGEILRVYEALKHPLKRADES